METKNLSLESFYQILNNNYKKIKSFQKTIVSLNNKTQNDDNIHQVIDESLTMINKYSSENQDLIDLRLSAIKATLLYEKSKLLSSIDKPDEAKEILSNTLDNINNDVSKNEMIYIALRMMNHYAYILTKKDNFKEAQIILEKAGSLYHETKKSSVFYTSEELFTSTPVLPESLSSSSTSSSSSKQNKFERLVTNNLQMLAVIYNKQGMTDKYLEHRHMVLSRELDMEEGDPLNWAQKTVDLAKQLFAKNKFSDAKHHLTAAEKILDNQKEVFNTKKLSDGLIDDYNQIVADVANGWVKYGLQIFNVSKMNAVKHFYHKSNEMLEKIWISPFEKNKKVNLNETNEPDFSFYQVHTGDLKKRNEQRRKTLESIREEEESCLFCQKEIDELNNKINKNNNQDVIKDKSELLNFKLLNLTELEVTANPIEDTEQARDLFNFTHEKLKSVRSFYSLENHPMEYINAIMDLSELYKYLAFYEEDIESQYGVHKLRADALETLSAILREVRPHWYMAVSVELLRELAEVQLEMMGLNLRRIYAAQTSDSNQSTIGLQKINVLSNLHEKLKQVGENLRSDPNFNSNI